MLTKEFVRDNALKRDNDRPICAVIEPRDYFRLIDWFPVGEWHCFGVGLKDGADTSAIPPPKPWTEEAIKAQLEEDLEFAFEKAFDKRGISANLMHDVIGMWVWILEDNELLEMFRSRTAYAQYGLPFLKAVAVKYGFSNPIGDDRGTEDKYASDGI